MDRSRDVQEADGPEFVGGQRPVVGVIAVGGDKCWNSFPLKDSCTISPGRMASSRLSSATGPRENSLRVRKLYKYGTPVQAGAFWLASM